MAALKKSFFECVLKQYFIKSYVLFKVCQMLEHNISNQSSTNPRKLVSVKNEVTNGLSLNDYEVGDNPIFPVKIM